MIEKGLVIASPWIEKILAGEKTWEIRSKTHPNAGRIALCKKGGEIVATCAIGEARPLAMKEFLNAIKRHCVSPRELKEFYAGRQIFAWPLSDVRVIDPPIEYKHAGGGSWVTLSAKNVREFRRLQES